MGTPKITTTTTQQQPRHQQ